MCVAVEFFGCPSSDGLISSRLPQTSIINPDLKYDGWISDTTARGKFRSDVSSRLIVSSVGGLGILNDGETSKYLHWSSVSAEPIFLLFAFDSIKEFRSIDFDLKCSRRTSTSCTLKIQIGILESIRESTPVWTNQFRSITIQNNQSDDQTTLTHLILSVAQRRGQFVLIQIIADDGFALSEVSFDNRNEFEDDQQEHLPSSIYIENHLRRLESIAYKSTSETTKSSILFLLFEKNFRLRLANQKLVHLLVFLLVLFALLVIVGLFLWIFSRHVEKDEQFVVDFSTPRDSFDIFRLD